ncbi:uncharacterized protein LOC132270245 [Cornus florida]|uniref:uncharacterized protein LOC132270245 n=1 Tax=Cornus florida TaxID=4283 RepID=UPI00289E2311|nr:uncharacterized protein LOC132270245 [Cornus florida]
MACVLHYVDKNGHIVECFVGFVHVTNTTAISLKAAIDNLFSRHGLNISRLRGQGYDGASNIVVNVAGGSCKRCDILREQQIFIVADALDNGELLNGQGLNQNISLKRSSDSRWGSHYNTLISVITMFSATVCVLELILMDGSFEQKFEVSLLLQHIQSFKFIFSLHMMRVILGVTNELPNALQRKDEEIVIAISYVKVCKNQLQRMRESGWDSLLDVASSFCVKHGIPVPNIDDPFSARGRPRPKIIRLAEFSAKEFSPNTLIELGDQLNNYIADVGSRSEFEGLKGIGDPAKKMVETKRDKMYSLIYLLMILALILLVATATVERAFSTMKIVKNRLHNKMGDEWMSDSLVVYIEKDISIGIVVLLSRYVAGVRAGLKAEFELEVAVLPSEGCDSLVIHIKIGYILLYNE